MKYKSILITGGTGSFGKAFTSYILQKYKNIRKIIIFSRDEFKQYEMSNSFSAKENEKLRFFIGDIRDKERLELALESVDVVIHAAALKQVPIAEYNPFEFVKTNIFGANNLIEACLKKNVRNVIALSTDKAVSPINFYGATKLCSDKLFCAANNIKGEKKIKFTVVRYGNVFASRGSAYSVFASQYKKNKTILLTDKRMTRFNIFLEDAVQMVDWALKNSLGGEIFVPKLDCYKIIDFIRVLFPDANIKEIGIRPGEKLHEEMIAENDSNITFDLGKYYAVVNKFLIHKIYEKYKKNKKIKRVKSGFFLSSNQQNNFLSIKQLKENFKNK